MPLASLKFVTLLDKAKIIVILITRNLRSVTKLLIKKIDYKVHQIYVTIYKLKHIYRQKVRQELANTSGHKQWLMISNLIWRLGSWAIGHVATTNHPYLKCPFIILVQVTRYNKRLCGRPL